MGLIGFAATLKHNWPGIVSSFLQTRPFIGREFTSHHVCIYIYINQFAYHIHTHTYVYITYIYIYVQIWFAGIQKSMPPHSSTNPKRQRCATSLWWVTWWTQPQSPANWPILPIGNSSGNGNGFQMVLPHNVVQLPIVIVVLEIDKDLPFPQQDPRLQPTRSSAAKNQVPPTAAADGSRPTHWLLPARCRPAATWGGCV